MDWLETRMGRGLLREESHQVAVALDSLFGDQFLQLGCWGSPDLFRRHARTRRAAVAAGRPAPGIDLVTDLESSGVASDSIDIVLLPHVLEMARDPYAILREVDRVLRPDGHVIVLGFNMLGWWGVRRMLSRGRFPPGVQHLISGHRLRDWLRLLSYTADSPAFYHFRAPFTAPVRIPREPVAADESGAGVTAGRTTDGLRRARAAGYRALRYIRHRQVFAAGYLMVARKEVAPLMPVRPVFRRRRELVGGLVKPTTRNVA